MRDLFRVIRANQSGPVDGLLLRVGLGNVFSGNHAIHDAAHAKFFGERTGVDALNAGDAVFFQILIERLPRAPTADHRRKFAHHKAGDVRLIALDVIRIHAVVADLRISHRHDLPFVRGVREDFLIPCHRSVEANLAASRGARAKTFAVENRAVFECENCHWCWVGREAARV